MALNTITLTQIVHDACDFKKGEERYKFIIFGHEQKVLQNMK
jgi:hypothetical protein